MSRVCFYKHEVEKGITQGYHDESMQNHEGGIHYLKFLNDKNELELAVDEYLKMMSDL